ncbi:hypothetical protein TcCL_NonESM11812 [Trypanosoma cruzi]|nr:hypothetical protein TcCL_NonESM11812 [Trypanosoma cruzi]
MLPAGTFARPVSCPLPVKFLSPEPVSGRTVPPLLLCPSLLFSSASSVSLSSSSPPASSSSSSSLSSPVGFKDGGDAVSVTPGAPSFNSWVSFRGVPGSADPGGGSSPLPETALSSSSHLPPQHRTTARRGHTPAAHGQSSSSPSLLSLACSLQHNFPVNAEQKQRDNSHNHAPSHPAMRVTHHYNNNN